MAQNKDNAIKIVQAALRSDRDFETYKPQIIQKVKASDDIMIKATVDTVKKYLKDKKKEGFSKLTALMLLKECMDTKNAAIVEYTHTKILRRLGLIAQGKDKCLPKDTSDALVKLFSQLLRECIVVWNDWFGYDKKKNPTKYKKTFDAVFAKVEKPTKLVHFTKPEQPEDRVLPQSINQSEVRSDNGRSPYQNLEASRPGVSDKVDERRRDEEEDEPPKKKFEIKPQQDPFVEKMTALMKHIKGNKEMLYEQMAVSEEPDQQGVKMILQNLIKANQQLADNWDELEAKEFPTKDEIADQAVLDNEVIEELVTEYNKMVKKEISMEDYRVFVIKTLSDPAKNGPGGPPQLSQKPSEVSKGQELSPAVNNKSSAATPAQVQAQSQSQSQSQQKPQQNDGFDLDAFEEASPELRQQQQAEERAKAAKLAQEKAQRDTAVPVRDTVIAGPPDRRAPAPGGSVGGSQASEGGTRKAPRNFRDLFTNDPKDSRGRKAGTGSRRDKSNLDDSKGSVGFGKSWDVNPQGQSQRNRAQQQNKGQQGGFGVDDFDDLPAADPTGSYDDTSNMSADSRTYDFNYDRSRAVDKSRSRLDPRDHQKAAPMFSPSGNVLPPNDEGFNIRGTRKETASPSYKRPSARDIDDALYEAERYDTGGNNWNEQVNNINNRNVNPPTSASGSRNLIVDTDSANKRYDQRTNNNMSNNVSNNVNNKNNNRQSDGNGNFGFGNPFGGEDNNENNNYAPESAGFGGNSKPNLQVNGVPQDANINASRRNTPVSSNNQNQNQNQPPAFQQQQQQQQQRQQQHQQQQQQRNQPAPPQNVVAPTATGQNPRFAPIERPSFLNTLGSTSTINVSTFEGPAMRQADDLIERARRLTSQSRPQSHIDARGPNMRSSVAGGGNYPVPTSLDHQYQPIPPLFSAEPIRPSLNEPVRRSSLERVGPFVSSTFNNAGVPAPLVNSAVLNQSSSVGGGDGFLREIERAREASKAIAAKYSSPAGSRRQSDSGLIANLAAAAALQGGTASSNLASAVLQGPTKYTNGGDSSAVLNTSVRVETEMRQSHYSQYGSRARSPIREDDSVTFVGGGAEIASIRDTGRGLATERSEKLSRGYGTAKFPEAEEGKEMTRAAQLIEKARRLREESRQRKTFAGEESEKKEYLFKTPSRVNEASHNLKESSYLDQRREERPMKASQVEVRYVNRMEEQQPIASAQTFYRYEPNSSFDHTGNNAVNIRSRDVQASQYASRGRQNETPVRLIGPDGAVYEEVRQGYGIGRKPSEEPRRTAHAGGRDSPLTTDMVRGRSRETRHETLGQWRHQQQEFGVGMRESRVDMKRSAYHEAKELLENSRRQNEVSAHAERRGRFENISPERLQKTKSPLRERKEQVQEAVELKANETLRIIERPVPGGVANAAARNYSRSPAPRDLPGRGSVTANSLKASMNAVPATNLAVAQQAKTSSSSQLANEIKSQLNALKQSLVGRREKSDSVSSKATLQLDGSSNSVPQIAVIHRERERGPIIVQREEVKVHEEGPRKTGVRVDSRDMMGQYSSRVAERELKRSAAVGESVVNHMRVEKRESETTPAVTPYGTDEGFSRRLNVKEISATQGVKLTMDDSNVWEEESTVRTRNLDESFRRDREREYRELVGPSYNKPKVGRAVHFDYYLFDQITNAVFANGQGKDVDGFKAACLQNKAVLFDSAKLKIDVITRMEDEEGRTGGNKLKVILHYANKSNESITGFSADITDNSVVQNPRISGNNLPPKYQLKQELYLDFSYFKNLCYTIMITYQHEGFPYSAKVPLPLSVNKFMKLRTTHSGEYKRQWKNLKGGSVKSKYKHINAKFIRDHTEVNKYFDNCLVDVTPTLNPKRKRKYGGVFVLPDGSEHYLRIAMDTSRIKFAVASKNSGSQSADWVVQYLSYLLTV